MTIVCARRRRSGRAGVIATATMTVATMTGAGGLGLSACSSSPRSPATTGPAPVVKAYSAFGLTIEAAFPHKPAHTANPAQFEGLFAGHQATSLWSIGDIGLLDVGSYALLLVAFPKSVSALQITDELKSYDGNLVNTTLFGRPALKEVSPTTDGRFGGTFAFSKGNVLVIAVGYDTASRPVRLFIDSVRAA